MEAVLDRLLHSPKLTIYVRQLEQVLTEEQGRRQQFYDCITISPLINSTFCCSFMES